MHGYRPFVALTPASAVTGRDVSNYSFHLPCNVIPPWRHEVYTRASLYGGAYARQNERPTPPSPASYLALHH